MGLSPGEIFHLRDRRDFRYQHNCWTLRVNPEVKIKRLPARPASRPRPARRTTRRADAAGGRQCSAPTSAFMAAKPHRSWLPHEEDLNLRPSRLSARCSKSHALPLPISPASSTTMAPSRSLRSAGADVVGSLGHRSRRNRRNGPSPSRSPLSPCSGQSRRGHLPLNWPDGRPPGQERRRAHPLTLLRQCQKNLREKCRP